MHLLLVSIGASLAPTLYWPTIFELVNLRMAGFKLSKDQPVIQDMVARIEKYNNALEAYALHDHQVCHLGSPCRQ